jgi:chitinase
MTRHAYLVVFAAAFGLALGASPVQAQVSCSGVPAFAYCTAYANGAAVTYNGSKYTSIAAIPNNRDCPPNSPYTPPADNWWTLNGTCSGSATPTPTSQPGATATRTPTATATTGSGGGGSIANGAYRVVNKNSGKCVDAAAAGTANGTVVQQYTCNGSNAQVWVFTSAGSGYYEVATQNNTAQGWDVTGGTGATGDSVKIQLWAYGGATNQQFQAVSEGGGYYHLVARNSGKCLDVPAASTADAVQLQQYTCNGTAAQSFQVTNTTAATPTATTNAPPTPTQSSGGGTGNFPARFAAPYVATWNNPDLASLASSTGNKFWTMAFIINGSGTCNPMWNGDTALSTTFNVAGLRAAGGDAIVSFGGASGVEIAASCTDVASTQAAYQKVINAFGAKAIDLDIESGYESDAASIDRRNKAMKGLQSANPGLRVDYTLGVSRSGLPSAQQNVIANAKSNGVNVGSVNIMAMDYGPCYTDMGQAAIDAANGAHSQTGLSIGVTPMIGVNDTTCENFTTNDANILVSWAQGQSFVNLLAYWVQDSDPNHSYINIFKTFH